MPDDAARQEERELCARIVEQSARRLELDAEGQPAGGQRDLRQFAARELRNAAGRVRERGREL